MRCGAFTAPKHLGQRAWIPAWSRVEGFALARRGDDGDIRVIKCGYAITVTRVAGLQSIRYGLGPDTSFGQGFP